MTIRPSLLGHAIFDVIQETLRHQWVFVEVHQMRSLKPTIDAVKLTVVHPCIKLWGTVWSVFVCGLWMV